MSTNLKVKVLITSIGSLLGQGIFKSLKKSELNCEVIGTDYVDWAPGLQWANYGYILPDILRDKSLKTVWLQKLIEIISTHKVNILLIGQDYELDLISKEKKNIENNTNCIVIASSKRVIDIGNDKWKTVSFLKKNNFYYPNSTLPANIDNFVNTVNFPMIVKPRFGRRSMGVTKVHNMNELKYAIDSTKHPIIQEYLQNANSEYTCGLVCYKDKILTNVSLKRYLKDGNTHLAYSSNYELIDKYVELITRLIKPFGPINFQLRLTDKGPTVFEINPRFSGTTPFREMFGVNEVEAIINKIIYDKTKIYSKKYGAIVRYFEEQFISNKSVVK